MRIGPSLFGRTQGEEERGRDEPAVPRHMVPGRTAQARRTGGGSEPRFRPVTVLAYTNRRSNLL